MQKGVVKKIIIVNVLWLAVFILAPALFISKAEAAGLTEAYVRLDRMKASTFTSGLICAKTPAADTGTEVDVKVVFPADFTVSATTTDWAISTTDLPFGATIWPGIAQATSGNNSTKTVIFPSTALSTSTLYCFRWTNSTAALQTGSSGNNKVGTITTEASGSSALDTSSYATSIITDDQIVVNAVVPPLFTFSLAGGNTDTFTTNLSTGVSVTSGKTFTISTNAANGWVAWIKSATANGLTSASTGANVSAAATANDNTPTVLGTNKGYAVNAAFTDSATGTGNVTQGDNWGKEFAGDGTTSGGTAETTFRPVAASDGTTDGDTITLKELASISAIQKAATDYTDTLTVVAAGRF